MHKLFVLPFLAFLFFQPNDPHIGQKLFSHVERIQGRSHEGRLAYIKKQLQQLGVVYRTMPFDTTVTRGERTRKFKGENIIVRMGSGAKHVVVGAHADAVANSPGANDNGGGVAVVLGLIEYLRDRQWNFSIDFCFFDQEEVGLVGSAVYVARYAERPRHLAMINLDVVGTGEELYVGPVGGGDDDVIMPFVRKAAAQVRYPLHAVALYPGSDHLSFAAASLENISLSIVPKGDAERLTALLSGTGDRAQPPRVLEVMHTPRDSAVYVSPTALAASFEFTKTILHLLNDSLND